MRLYHALAVALFCCFVACQKEPDDTLPTTTACKLDAIYYYDDNGVAEDTVSYEYSGEKVSAVNYSDYFTELSYSGDRVVRRDYYLYGQADLLAFDEFTYFGDGTLARVDFYLTDPGIPTPYLFYRYDLTWSGSKLVNVLTSVDTGGTGLVPYLEYSYTYTGDNITAAEETDHFNMESGSWTYSHDTSPNYYGKNPALWLTDNLFVDFNGLTLPIALSANNVTGITGQAGSSNSFTYTTTNDDNIETLRVDGSLLARYLYKCQ